MPTVSKAAATRHLAQVLQDQIEPNTGEKSINQLRWLVNALSNTTAITKETWADKKSNINPEKHGQMRVKRHEKTHETQYLPATIDGNAHTKESQKIAASTANPPVLVSPPTPAFIESKEVTGEGCVCVEVCKGMYDLPQEGLLAQELLATMFATRLAIHGYTQSKLTPGLWKHKTRPIQFCSVVDDFGVKYVSKEQAMHLKTILEQNYKLSNAWLCSVSTYMF